MVATLIATIINLVKAKRATADQIDGLFRESNQDRGGGGALDMGQIELQETCKTAREKRSLSKRAVGLGGGFNRIKAGKKQRGKKEKIEV